MPHQPSSPAARLATAAALAALVASLAAAPAPARALQPLDAFLRGARGAGTDVREARANAEAQSAQAGIAAGRLLPGLSARGVYTRNQYETVIDFPPAAGSPPMAITLTPANQLDIFAAVSVPLVDLAAFARASAARRSAASARESEASAELQTDASVAQDYYQLVANVGLVAAAERALSVSRASLALFQQRFEAGAAARLDLDRAQAEVERAIQQLASAQLQVELAARSLASRTGVAPDLSGEALELPRKLDEEPPLTTFTPAGFAPPSLRAATEARMAQEGQARAQKRTLLPALSGAFNEHVTNAAGFIGHEYAWQATLTLSWALDFTTAASIRAQEALAEGARAREERARLAALDGVHRAWNTVHTGIARSRSAAAQAEVSRRAAELADDRYRAGAATQLDLLQAQRDAFAADANRVQADADLVNARAQLRVASGQPLLQPPERGRP